MQCFRGRLVWPRLGLAMRLRIYAVHADDAHMRIHVKILMRISHIQRQKRQQQQFLILMYVLKMDLAVESASHQYE